MLKMATFELVFNLVRRIH